MRYGLAWVSFGWAVAGLALGGASSPPDASPAVVDPPMAVTRSLPLPDQGPAVVDSPVPRGRVRMGNARPVPSPLPLPIPAALPKLPKEFQILLTNSVFSKNVLPGQLGADGRPLNGAGGPNGGPNGGPGGGPSPTMALCGVVRQDGVYIAIFEDPMTHQHQDVHEGEVLGGGKITAITQHGLSFAVADKVTQVQMWQNLRGEPVTPPPPPAPAAPAGGPPGPNGGPPGAVQAGAVLEGAPEGPDGAPRAAKGRR